eukprot:jgi/Ulvmu1/770/UM010_0144.1
MEVQGPGYSFEVVKKLKFIGHEAKATVRTSTRSRHTTCTCTANWLEHSVKIYLGKKKEGGRLLGYAHRQLNFGELFLDRQTYNLTVLPGSDAALCVILCVAFDEFWNEDN